MIKRPAMIPKMPINNFQPQAELSMKMPTIDRMPAINQ